MINEKTELLTYDDSLTVGDLQDYLKKSLRVWSVLEDLNEFKDQLKIFKKNYKSELKEANELSLRLATEHKHKLEDLLDLDQLPYVNVDDFENLKKTHASLIKEKAEVLEEKLKNLTEDTKKSIKRNFSELDVAINALKKEHLTINTALSRLDEISTLQQVNDEIFSLLENKQDIIDFGELEKQILDKVNQKLGAISQSIQVSQGVGYTAQILARLVDVSINNPTNGQVLTYNSSTQRWTNQASSGGGGTWGSITGTLSNQTDLQSALDAKQATLVSGTNIKTINSTSLLGSGDISITASAGGSDTQVQFNDGGALGGDVDLTYNKTTNALTVGGLVHTPIVQAHTSAGLTLEAQGGSDVLIIGAGGGVNATAYGGWNFDAVTASTIAGFGASKTLESLSTATYPSLTELSYVKGVTSAIQTQLDGKVDENTAITGATKTKITYDSKGLITSGADATTADIADSTNKRYVTDAQLTVIGNTSGTNTGDQNLFSTIAVSGQSNVVADSTSDTLTLVAGSNVTITTDAATDSITINSTGGGSSAFNDLTSGTNTTAAMVVGTGASLGTSGSGTIAATTATTSTNGTVANEATDTTCFPLFVTAATGDLPFKSNTGLTYNSNTNNLGCTTFTGALSGNATTATALATPRTIGGVSFDGSANIVPQTIQSVNEATDTTCFPLFITASGSQSLQPCNNTSLTFNSLTGALGATSITVGNTGLTVGSSTPFSDSAGTLTLQNIDAIDATTETTLEAALELDSLQGNLSVSHLNSGTGASSSTFWRGDGTWATPSGGSGSAITKDINQTTHGFAVQDVVYLNGSTYTKAQADTSANSEVVGIVSTVTDANNFTITTSGRVTGLSGLTAGEVYFLSPSSAGAITTTQPTTTGQVVKPILVADSTTSGYFINYRGSVVSSNDIVSLTPSANQNDYSTGATISDAGYLSTIRIAPTNSIIITGISATGAANGKKITIKNTTSFSASTARMILFPRESTSSTAANRFSYPPMSIPLILMPNDSITFVYNTTTSRWEFEDGNRHGSPEEFFNVYTDYFNGGGSGDLQTTGSSGAGAGANVPTTGIGNATIKAIGMYGSATGTTTTGYAYTGSNSQAIKGGSGCALFLGRATVPTLSDGTDTYKCRIGLNDGSSTGTPVDGVYWEYDQTTTTDWRTATSNASTTTFNTVTGLTVATTTMPYLGFFINGDWTNVEYFYSTNGVDWTIFATATTTNIPTGTGNLFGCQFGITKSAGTTSRNFDCDLMGLRYDLIRGT